MMDMKKVIIADSNEGYLYALQNFIEQQIDIGLLNVCDSLRGLNAALKQTEVNLLIVAEGIFEEKAVRSIRKINKLYPDVKIVALSRGGSSLMKEEMIQAGVDVYISKWKLEELLKTLKSN